MMELRHVICIIQMSSFLITTSGEKTCEINFRLLQANYTGLLKRIEYLESAHKIHEQDKVTCIGYFNAFVTVQNEFNELKQKISKLESDYQLLKQEAAKTQQENGTRSLLEGIKEAIYSTEQEAKPIIIDTQTRSVLEDIRDTLYNTSRQGERRHRSIEMEQTLEAAVLRLDNKVVHLDDKIQNLTSLDWYSLRGQKGEKGEAGTEGIKGEQGTKGGKGERGLSGMKGRPGEDGVSGSTGQRGPPGTKGDKGQRGLDGVKGDMGLTGAVGPKGVRGEPGARGLKGQKGQPSQGRNKHERAAFSARLTHDLSGLVAGETIVFDEKVSDYGNNYDASNGKFTAPVPGYYVFTWTIGTKDDRNQITALVLNTREMGYSITDASGNDDAQSSNTVVIKMYAGQKAMIKTTGNRSYMPNSYVVEHDNCNTFSGWLLFKSY